VEPGDVEPGDVVPGDVVPGDVVPGDVVPGEVVPGEVVAGDEPPGDVVPGAPLAWVPPGDVVAIVVPEVDPLCDDAPDRCWVRGGESMDRDGDRDGGGDPSGIASPTGVIPVPGTPTGTGGSAAVAGPVATRTAPAYPPSHIVVTSTNSPGCGACTILPSPRYIATWCTVDRSLGS
jgi:hypothetical protein